MVAAREDIHLAAELETLAAALETVDIGPGAVYLATERDRLVFAVRSYLVPRLEDPAAPLLVVFTGPTGSGKSTLVNSLAGRELSKTGAVRPTTTAPVVLTKGDRVSAFDSIAGVSCDVVPGGAPILDSLVLVDTPDIDSTSADHRFMAEALVDTADIIVFVSSALRYADDAAWQVLRRARSRGIDVIQVLNRVDSDTAGAAVDFESRLRSEGLEDRLLIVPEHHVAPGGHAIPSLAVRSLARRLAAIAGVRRETSASTTSRVLETTLRQVGDLVRSMSRLKEQADELEAELSVALAERARHLDLATASPDQVTDPPAPSGWLARARWRRRSGLNDERLMYIERRVASRITAAVVGDIRAWATEEKVAIGDLKTVTDMVPAKSEAWVRFVARVATEQVEAEPRALEIALLRAALTGVTTPVLQSHAGDEAETLEARASRKLETRVGIVYDEAARAVVAAHGCRQGSLDTTDLRSALGVAVSASSLVDA